MMRLGRENVAVPGLRPVRSRRERGSALLIVVFFAALMIVAASAAVPSVLTQGKREKEEDLIWRGEQYARAVKLFYRKNGRFPTSMDELSKPQNDVRFLRRAYAEPMNTEDGSWRLIYIGANGQLIGSTTRSNALLNLPQRPGSAGPGTTGTTGARPPGTGATPGTGTGAGSGAETGTGTSNSTPGTLGSGPIIGGNIIGVASKVAKSSIKVYKGATIYRDWEFIWDPTQDAALGGPGMNPPGIGTPAGAPAGQPAGTPTGNPPPPPRVP
ncbi:MAG: hypothetical protein ACRD5F_16610 [Candidatus Acidiferrales bacterium]